MFHFGKIYIHQLSNSVSILKRPFDRCTNVKPVGTYRFEEGEEICILTMQMRALMFWMECLACKS